MRINSLTAWLRSLRKKNSQYAEKNTPISINHDAVPETPTLSNPIQPVQILMAFIPQPKLDAIAALGKQATTISDGFAGYPEEWEESFLHANSHFNCIYSEYLDSGKLYMIVRSWSKQKPFDPNDEFYGLLSIADHVMLAHFLISIDGDNRDQKDSVNSRRSGRSPETLL